MQATERERLARDVVTQAQNARRAEKRKQRAVEKFLDANFVVTAEYVGWRRGDFDLIARFFNSRQSRATTAMSATPGGR